MRKDWEGTGMTFPSRKRFACPECGCRRTAGFCIVCDREPDWKWEGQREMREERRARQESDAHFRRLENR
jgi:hypothetical protein